jgi:hypothetical protein
MDVSLFSVLQLHRKLHILFIYCTATILYLLYKFVLELSLFSVLYLQREDDILLHRFDMHAHIICWMHTLLHWHMTTYNFVKAACFQYTYTFHAFNAPFLHGYVTIYNVAAPALKLLSCMALLSSPKKIKIESGNWQMRCVYVCMDVCMYGWMDVCMYGCMYVCMYVTALKRRSR